MQEVMIIIWFVVIISAALIEANTMDLTSIWFSISALIVFILAALKVDPIVQIIIFVVISSILLVSLRPLIRKYFKKNIIKTNADRLIGKVAVCTKSIKAGERGEVKIEGKYWMAISNENKEIKPDEKVEVLAIEGVKLIVVKL